MLRKKMRRSHQIRYDRMGERRGGDFFIKCKEQSLYHVKSSLFKLYENM